MKSKEVILNSMAGHQYYHPDGNVYILKEMALSAMESYAQQFQSEKLKVAGEAFDAGVHYAISISGAGRIFSEKPPTKEQYLQSLKDNL